jgi:hypothetical protein
MKLVLGVALSSALYAQSVTVEPFDWQQRWDQYVDRTYNWKNVGAVAAEDAFEQSFQLRKCGRPPYCMPHHVGGSLLRRTSRTTIELGFGALLKEDIRRRPSGLPGFRQRVVFALTHAALAKGPNGEWRPAYSRFAGTLGAVAVTSAWHGRPLTTGRLARSFGFSATNYFQDALFSEFEPDLRRLGMRAWRNLRGNH